MDFTVSDDQRALRDQIVRFARAELNDGVEERDKAHEFPRENWLKCGRLGLQGLPIPQEFGGSGLDALSTAMAIESLGYGCEDSGLVFSICAHLLACSVPIWLNGSDAQKRRYLPGLCDGSMIAVNAMTEPEGGSDPFTMRTKAVYDGDAFVVTGTKTFGTNAPVADLALLYAVTDPTKKFNGGVTAFIAEAGAPGFARGQKFEKLGLRTSPIGELVFDGMRLQRDQVVGAVGAGGPIFFKSMEWERICLVAAHVGVMDRLLERSIEQARTRIVAGRKIGGYQAISHRIADMKVRIEAARLLTYRAAAKLDRGGTVGMDAAITKLFVSESLVKTALETIQILGGYGIMTEYGVERALRDSIASTIYSGTSETQRNIIAQWLGVTE